MRAAILCPGPSVHRFTGNGYQLLIGVNRVPIWYAVDIWAAGDYPTVESAAPGVIGSPALLTTPEAVSWFAGKNWRWRGETLEISKLFGFIHPSQIDWPLFTFTQAIVYAASQGFTAIDCYGADWSGTLDADGKAAGGNRSDDRWILESRLFGGLQSLLASRNIDLQRVIR